MTSPLNPPIRLGLTPQTTMEDLLGRFVINEATMRPEFQKGPLRLAMERGCDLEVTGFDSCTRHLSSVLVMFKGGYMEDGCVVYPNPGFRVVAIINEGPVHRLDPDEDGG